MHEYYTINRAELLATLDRKRKTAERDLTLQDVLQLISAAPEYNGPGAILREPLVLNIKHSNKPRRQREKSFYGTARWHIINAPAVVYCYECKYRDKVADAMCNHPEGIDRAIRPFDSCQHGTRRPVSINETRKAYGLPPI